MLSSKFHHRLIVGLSVFSLASGPQASLLPLGFQLRTLTRVAD